MGWRDYWRSLGGNIACQKPHAKWRQRPASPYQLAALREYGMEPPAGLTQGQADAYIRGYRSGVPLPLCDCQTCPQCGAAIPSGQVALRNPGADAREHWCGVCGTHWGHSRLAPPPPAAGGG